MRKINTFLLILPFVIFLLLIICSIKTSILFCSIYSLGMYVHISITTLCNAFIGKEVNTQGDMFWKMFFLIVFALSFTIFFSI